MKIILIIFSISIFSNNLFSKTLFDTTFYNVEFISNNIENDKLAKIKEIKFDSIKEILIKTLEYENYNKINQNLSEDLINTFIKNIIVDNEKIINDKYFSKIKINFNKKKIIKYFRNEKIPYVEYHPKKLLLIIYEKDQVSDNLFTKNNNYYSHFINNLNSNSLFQIPNLDINDRFILNKKDIEKRNIEKIMNFSKKYNINEIIIVQTEKNKNSHIFELALLSNGEILEKKMLFNKKKLNNFFKILETESLNIWKKVNQIQNNLLNVLNCKVSYYNMLELKEIKSNLNNISLIENLNVKSISYRKIEFDIYYYGNLKILSNTLKLNKLKLNNNKNVCTLRLK